MADVPNRRRRRRGRRAAPILAALALLLWLGAHGLGGGPKDSRQSEPAGPAATSATSTRVVTPRPSEATSGPAEVPDPGVEVGELAVVDRLWGCLRRMADAHEGEAFAVGFAAWDAARRLPLNTVQREQVQTAGSSLTERLAVWLRDSVDGAARRGEVLLAAARLSALQQNGERALLEIVERVLRDQCGWPDWNADLGAQTDGDERALPRGARVRVWLDGEWSIGTVAVARADEVSVRVGTPRGDRFPTILRVDVEPITADPELALGQAAAAARLGRPRLAAAWRVRAAALR